MRCRLLIWLVPLAAFLFSSAPAAADVNLARVFRPTTVNAYSGRVVWSRYNPSTDNWSLMTLSGGLVSAVGVPPNDFPFDIDLGPNGKGDIVGVYSRCSGPPDLVGTGVGGVLPRWSTARGCDVYAHDFTDRSANRRFGQTRVEAVSSAHASEFLPTLWRDRIAFARVYSRSPSLPRIYAAFLDRPRRPVRLPGGPASDFRRATPTGMDLVGHRLAFGWSYARRGDGFDEVRLDTVGGKHMLVQRSVQGHGAVSALELTAPAIWGGSVLYAVVGVGEAQGNSVFRRYEIATRTFGEAPAPASVFATAFDAGNAYYIHPTGSCTGVDNPDNPQVATPACEIAERLAVTFSSAPR